MVRHICLDDELEKLSHEFCSKAWNESRQRCLCLLEQYLQAAGQDSLTSPKSRLLIVMDDNNYYRSMRFSCFQLARRFKAAFLQIHLPCNIETSLERNANRRNESGQNLSRRVPDVSIKRMAERLEVPSEDIPWERPCLFLTAWDYKGQDLDYVWKWINNSWETYVSPPYLCPDEGVKVKLKAQAATQSSLMHQLDLRTRAMTASALERLDPSSRAEYASALNLRRRQLLDTSRAIIHKSELDSSETQLNCDKAEDAEGVILARYAKDIQEVLRTCYR